MNGPCIGWAGGRPLFLALLGAGLAVASAAAQLPPRLELAQDELFGLEPGEEFTLFLEVVNPGPLTIGSYDFFVSANQDDAFLLAGQTVFAPLDRPLIPGTFPQPVLMAGSQDLGAETSAGAEGFGMGRSSAQSLTFAVAPNLPAGTYTLQFAWNYASGLAGPNLVDSDFQEYGMAQPLSVTIFVVPEPAGMVGLGILGLMGLCAVRKIQRGERVFSRPPWAEDNNLRCRRYYIGCNAK